VDLVAGEADIILELPDQKLEVSWSPSLSNGCFPNTPASYSVKWLWGYDLSFDSIFIVDLTRVLTGINSYFRCGS
jgi:hypothetical protein